MCWEWPERAYLSPLKTFGGYKFDGKQLWFWATVPRSSSFQWNFRLIFISTLCPLSNSVWFMVDDDSRRQRENELLNYGRMFLVCPPLAIVIIWTIGQVNIAYARDIANDHWPMAFKHRHEWNWWENFASTCFRGCQWHQLSLLLF